MDTGEAFYRNAASPDGKTQEYQWQIFTLNQMTSDRLDQVLEKMSFSMDPVSYAIYILFC